MSVTSPIAEFTLSLKANPALLWSDSTIVKILQSITGWKVAWTGPLKWLRWTMCFTIFVPTTKRKMQIIFFYNLPWNCESRSAIRLPSAIGYSASAKKCSKSLNMTCHILASVHLISLNVVLCARKCDIKWYKRI